MVANLQTPGMPTQADFHAAISLHAGDLPFEIIDRILSANN